MIKKLPVHDLTWLLRYWLGATMIFHGCQHLFFSNMSGFTGYLESLGIPFPTVLAYVAKISEGLGGLMIMLNIGTRLFSGLIIIVMAVAVLVAHKGLIFGEAELAFNYLILATILFFNPDIPFKIFKK